MPRGYPKKKRRSRSADEAPETVDGAEAETAPGAETVAWTIGEAIESVRAALEPFEADTRKRILRAVNAVLR